MLDRLEENFEHTQQGIRDSIARRDDADLNILNVTQVAEMLGCSYGTAYNYMRMGIITSFRKGSRWFTHDYVIDAIFTKGTRYIAERKIRKAMPRLVWRVDNGMDA